MNTHTNITGLPVVQIAGSDVRRITYRGEPVVTFAMVDEIHQRADGTAGRNFRENRDRFNEGEDFLELTSDEIRRMSAEGVFPPRSARGTILTQRGYLKLVKPMNDDRAWQVQGEMIDRYFVVEQAIAGVAPAMSPALSREVRLLTRMFGKMAKDMGLVGNQAVLSVARGVETMTGVNPMAVMGHTHIEAEQNEDMLNVSELGRRVGCTAQEMNLKLIGRGLQTTYRDGKGKRKYELTEEGKAQGGTWHDAQKAQGGRPIRQLMWPAHVASLFSGEGAA